MRFILVGPDGVGKTTFAKKFAEEYGLDYIGCTYREDNKLERTVLLLEQYDNVIFDRFYLPDHLVYSVVKQDVLSIEEEFAWAGIITSLSDYNDIVILYMDAGDDLLKERLESRGDEYIVFDEIEKIRLAYSKFLPILQLPVIKLRATKDGVEIGGFGPNVLD